MYKLKSNFLECLRIIDKENSNFKKIQKKNNEPIRPSISHVLIDKKNEKGSKNMYGIFLKFKRCKTVEFERTNNFLLCEKEVSLILYNQ